VSEYENGDGAQTRPFNLKMPAWPVALVVLVVIGCGGSGVSGGLSSPVLESMPAFQREILKDGEVTFPELERAFFSFLRCVDEAGPWQASGSIRPSGEADITVQWGAHEPSSVDDQLLDEAQSRCGDEYFMLVHGYYEPPAPDDEDIYSGRLSRQIFECMLERDVHLPHVPESQEQWLATVDELDTVGQMAFRECEQQTLMESRGS